MSLVLQIARGQKELVDSEPVDLLALKFLRWDETRDFLSEVEHDVGKLREDEFVVHEDGRSERSGVADCRQKKSE